MKKASSALIAVLFSAALLSSCSSSSSSSSSASPGLTVYPQALSSTDGEYMPGQANYWDLYNNFSLDDGSDDQFDGALRLMVGSTYYPEDLVYADLTYAKPLMGVAEGVKVASVSDGTDQWYSPLSGGYSAYLHSTPNSRLQQTLNLGSASGIVTLFWTENVEAYENNFAGAPATYRVVLRSTSGAELEELWRVENDGAFAAPTADLSAYRGRTVVLSFELAANWGLALIDDVSVVDGNAIEFVTNGDFESNSLTGWTVTAPSVSQNVTAAARTVEGLTVTRSFYTVPNKLWGRWVDLFENKTGSPITTTITYETNLGSDNYGIIYATPGTSNKALTTWDGSASDRDVSLVFGNATSVDFTSASNLSTFDGDDWIYVTYDITVPAGGRAAIVNFIVMGGTDTGTTAVDASATADEVDAEAAAIATNFRTDSQYRAGMTQTQLNAILNF